MNDEIFATVTTPKNAWKWALVVDGREVCLGIKREHLLDSQKMLGGEIVERKPVKKAVVEKKRRFAR